MPLPHRNAAGRPVRGGSGRYVVISGRRGKRPSGIALTIGATDRAFPHALYRYLPRMPIASSTK